MNNLKEEQELPTLSLKKLEKIAIEKALRISNGNPKKASEILGISLRKVQYRLSSWGKKSSDYKNI